MDGMWPRFLLLFVCLPMSDIVWQCVHYHFNFQLTRWVGGNGPVHVGKEEFQVKLLCSLITENILMMVYNMTILVKDCRVKLNRESVYLHGRQVTEFLSNSCVLAYEWHYHSNSQLTSWVGGNEPVHGRKVDKKWNIIIMKPHHTNYTDEGLSIIWHYKPNSVVSN